MELGRDLAEASAMLVQFLDALHDLPFALEPGLGKLLAAGRGIARGHRNGSGWKLCFSGSCLGEANPRPNQERLDRIANVLTQMPAVCHLDGQGHPGGCRFGIRASAVAADQFDGLVGLKPVLGRGHRSIRQQVDHLMSLQINQEGAIALATPPSPVINANDLDVCDRRHWHQVEGPEERRVGKRHPELRSQARSRFAGAGEADRLDRGA
jgi:hypothetical protein